MSERFSRQTVSKPLLRPPAPAGATRAVERRQNPGQGRRRYQHEGKGKGKGKTGRKG